MYILKYHEVIYPIRYIILIYEINKNNINLLLKIISIYLK